MAADPLQLRMDFLSRLQTSIRERMSWIQMSMLPLIESLERARYRRDWSTYMQLWNELMWHRQELDRLMAQHQQISQELSRLRAIRAARERQRMAVMGFGFP